MQHQSLIYIKRLSLAGISIALLVSHNFHILDVVTIKEQVVCGSTGGKIRFLSTKAQ